MYKKISNFFGRIVEVLVLVAILVGRSSTAFRDFVFFDQPINFSNMYLL